MLTKIVLGIGHEPFCWIFHHIEREVRSQHTNVLIFGQIADPVLHFIKVNLNYNVKDFASL